MCLQASQRVNAVLKCSLKPNIYKKSLHFSFESNFQLFNFQCCCFFCKSYRIIHYVCELVNCINQFILPPRKRKGLHCNLFFSLTCAAVFNARIQSQAKTNSILKLFLFSVLQQMAIAKSSDFGQTFDGVSIHFREYFVARSLVFDVILLFLYTNNSH